MRAIIKISMITMFIIVVTFGGQLLRWDRFNSGESAFKNEHPVLALEKLKPLAWLGDGTAQYLVGMIYATGGPGLSKNDAEAIYWFRRAARHAEKGEDPAAAMELNMALSYADDTNPSAKDMNESMKWLRLSAAGGNKKAIALLAKMEAEQKASTQKNENQIKLDAPKTP